MSKRPNLIFYCIDVAKGLVLDPDNLNRWGEIITLAETLLANEAPADLLDANITPDMVAEFIIRELKQWGKHSREYSRGQFRLDLYVNFIKCMLSNPGLAKLVRAHTVT